MNGWMSIEDVDSSKPFFAWAHTKINGNDAVCMCYWNMVRWVNVMSPFYEEQPIRIIPLSYPYVRPEAPGMDSDATTPCMPE